MRGGGIFQEASLPISAGESLCADAEVVTAGARPGARGEMVLSLLGRVDEPVVVGDLRAASGRGPVDPRVDLRDGGRAHSGFRIQFYDAPETPTLGIDAVDVR